MSLLNILLRIKNRSLTDKYTCKIIQNRMHSYGEPYEYKDDNLHIHCESRYILYAEDFDTYTTICIITNYKLAIVICINDVLNSYEINHRTFNYDTKAINNVLVYIRNINYLRYYEISDIAVLLGVESNNDELTFGAFLPSKIKSSCSTIN